MPEQMTLEKLKDVCLQWLSNVAGNSNNLPMAEARIRELFDAHLNAAKGEAVDTGNFVSDPLYLALDQLYERGWSDGEKHKHDPRGTSEWQRVLDIFRQYAHPASPDVVRDAERYRWLRDEGDSTWNPLVKRKTSWTTKEVDAAIDAAMAAREGGE